PVLRRVVGAVIQERWSILRKCPLALEPADEFQVAVEAAFRLAARTLIRCGLTLQTGFGSIHATACGLGHRYGPREGLGEQQRGERDGCDGKCLDGVVSVHMLLCSSFGRQ